MVKNFLDNNKDLGILFLRLGVGIAYAFIYGLPKVQGGPEMWTMVGGAMSMLGISFAPTFWGFMATLSEFVGGILLILGLFIRPATFFMAFTMFMAMLQHFSMKDQWYNVMLPIEMIGVFLALMFLGAGKYSLDYLFFGRKALTRNDG